VVIKKSSVETVEQGVVFRDSSLPGYEFGIETESSEFVVAE
jgi:hypothetical protein